MCVEVSLAGIYGRSLYIQHVQQWYVPEFSTKHRKHEQINNAARGAISDSSIISSIDRTRIHPGTWYQCSLIYQVGDSSTPRIWYSYKTHQVPGTGTGIEPRTAATTTFAAVSIT